MDIDLLSKMVKELILDNDRVVLPGLGCFVAEIVPSTFSDKGYTINPPYRRLYFRSKPDIGDELVRFYALSNNVSLEIAERIVSDFISELRSVLHLKKTVVFPGLGRLRATKENNVFFVADEDLDIYPDGFGLEPISLKTNQETPVEGTAAVEGLKSLLGDIPEPESAPAPEQAVVPEPMREQAPEPIQSPEPIPTPDPTPEPAPESDPTPDPTPELAPKSEPMPEPDSAPTPEPVKDIVDVRPKNRVWKKVMWAAVILVIIALVLFAAFFIISLVSPELLDSILYSKEELEIINWTV